MSVDFLRISFLIYLGFSLTVSGPWLVLVVLVIDLIVSINMSIRLRYCTTLALMIIFSY